MADAKAKGNEFFKQKNYEEAVKCYSEAIEANPKDHTIYGNRSASYSNMK